MRAPKVSTIGRERDALNVIGEEFVTIPALQKKMGLTYTQARTLLTRLINSKLITKISDDRGSEPAKYEVAK